MLCVSCLCFLFEDAPALLLSLSFKGKLEGKSTCLKVVPFDRYAYISRECIGTHTCPGIIFPEPHPAENSLLSTPRTIRCSWCMFWREPFSVWVKRKPKKEGHHLWGPPHVDKPMITISRVYIHIGMYGQGFASLPPSPPMVLSPPAPPPPPPCAVGVWFRVGLWLV